MMVFYADERESSSMNPNQIRSLRQTTGLTQQQFADLLGVSFVTLNRWENGQTKPSAMGAAKLQELSGKQPSMTGLAAAEEGRSEPVRLDFLGNPNEVRVLVEGERLSYGHLFNPAFATEISQIDPLPHQRIAVYQKMLPQSRLRFLLADDAGAGKTIMTGLYIRESLSRRTIHRVLVVAPAGLVGNWQKELKSLFQLGFKIVTGADAKQGNPFVGTDSDRIVVSVDSLRSANLFRCLGDASVPAYDLVVFDEAHKLSANRDPDGTFRPTDRYRLAETLAGVRDIPAEWKLPWTTHHLLLLTATPHMGKPYPYYCLWRLLEPELFSTETAFNLFPMDSRSRYFIRRVKEEMVNLQGQNLYPPRYCDTHSFDLTEGSISEQTLYEETTAYIQNYYNHARLLNRQAARFAMTVFQRRLASTTWALLCSFRRRLEKLETLIDDVQAGRIPEEELRNQQRRLDGKVKDSLSESGKTADEESTEGGMEEHEREEAEAMGAFIATSLAELVTERAKVKELIGLAEAVHADGQASKFDRMNQLLRSADFVDQKVIIYTEHKDTLEFLLRRLEAQGYADQVATIHGGLNFQQRDAQVERFRTPNAEGGCRFFIGTDAAAEGINLQFCWVLINYDIPWNPARLEQRMGRIHRYGQKKDRVAIINLIAGETREGKVVKTLLDKLEEIRKQLGSDKVFDVIGRVFADLSLTDYIQRAVISDDEAEREALALSGQLTVEQIKAIAAQEETLFGSGGDVALELPQLRDALAVEELRRLLPGYVRRYLEHAIPIVGVEIVGDPNQHFFLRPRKRGALDSLMPIIETYPERIRNKFTVYKPDDRRDAIFLHPGEPVFDRLSMCAIERCRPAGQSGAIFVDVVTNEPYLFHVARIAVVRGMDPGFPAFHSEEVVEQRLVGLRQTADNRFEETPVEHLLLLKPTNKAAPGSVAFIAHGETYRLAAADFLRGQLLVQASALKALEFQRRLQETQDYLLRAFDYQESELASARKRYTEKAHNGERGAQAELDRIKQQQRTLAARRASALAQAQREVELIQAGPVEIIATVLVQPSQNPEDIAARDAEVERIAMEIAMAFELSHGADVKDVSTPAQARLAGLVDYPGFDLYSKRPGQERGIEVKGRVGLGGIELTENEWAQACNLGDKYWLYAVFDCGSPNPRLLRVQNPFARLIAKARGSVVIAYRDIAQCAT